MKYNVFKVNDLTQGIQKRLSVFVVLEEDILKENILKEDIKNIILEVKNKYVKEKTLDVIFISVFERNKGDSGEALCHGIWSSQNNIYKYDHYRYNDKIKDMGIFWY
ncbi:hypothetical protein [Clostridium sp. KNHs214]|uniref:hypothetical protein n=1 Tax=Clostridium sp. KNHs214 TaxID=1540257 RepID=UPI000554F9FC|nr:hypothetical protein [Clostridium sp. KNHs214]